MQEVDMDWEVPQEGGIVDIDLSNQIYKTKLVDAIKKQLLGGYYAGWHFAATAADISSADKTKPKHTVVATGAANSIAIEICDNLIANKRKAKAIKKVMLGKISSENLGNVIFNLASPANGWEYRSNVGGAVTIRRVELTGVSVSDEGDQFNFHFVPKTTTV